jgi:hypothetical protein
VRWLQQPAASMVSGAAGNPRVPLFGAGIAGVETMTTLFYWMIEQRGKVSGNPTGLCLNVPEQRWVTPTAATRFQTKTDAKAYRDEFGLTDAEAVVNEHGFDV